MFSIFDARVITNSMPTEHPFGQNEDVFEGQMRILPRAQCSIQPNCRPGRIDIEFFSTFMA